MNLQNPSPPQTPPVEIPKISNTFQRRISTPKSIGIPSFTPSYPIHFQNREVLEPLARNRRRHRDFDDNGDNERMDGYHYKRLRVDEVLEPLSNLSVSPPDSFLNRKHTLEDSDLEDVEVPHKVPRLEDGMIEDVDLSKPEKIKLYIPDDMRKQIALPDHVLQSNKAPSIPPPLLEKLPSMALVLYRPLLPPPAESPDGMDLDL